MKYTVYKITNTINNKYYIGCHKTNDLNDGYMGSGKILKRAIKKYGLENFIKEYIAIFDNPEEMFNLEEELIVVGDPLSYNLKRGGEGGFDWINSNLTYKDKKTKMAAKKHLEYFYNNEEYREDFLNKLEKNRTKANAKVKQMINDGELILPSFKGKRHTKETKLRIGKANSKHQKGSGNSQYGTKWIYSLTEKRSMRIKKTDDIPLGWVEGRKIKF